MDDIQHFDMGETSIAAVTGGEEAAPVRPRRGRAATQSKVDAEKWPLSTPEGRWCGFGPYYAMFPVPFARSVVEQFCPPGGKLLDPFCGRGTAPFVATVLGRNAVGVDLNEVAWLFSSVKIAPWPDVDTLIQRLTYVGEQVSEEDGEAENDFQRWAWSPSVLAFLRAARRELDWRDDQRDRTLMGIILVYLHAKLGGGLSNQLRQSKAMSPDYSVRWWQEREMLPPELKPESFIEKRIRWRYKNGAPAPTGKGRIYLGDSRLIIEEKCKRDSFDLIFTSPPYLGVTNYRADQWIRWWMLGGPALPSWAVKERYGDTERYDTMLQEVFEAAARRSKKKATIYVRTDARRKALLLTADAITAAWPKHLLFGRVEVFGKATQTALFGDKEEKPGEVDILALPRGSTPPRGWKLIYRPDLG